MVGDSSDPLERLSATQIRLLRMVADGVTASKVLAQRTGLQPNSIDTYLQSAARQLGCPNRTSAAARLLELERENSQSRSQLRANRLVRRAKAVTFQVARAVWRFLTGVPLGGKRHDLSWAGVGLQILRVGIVGAVGLTALALILLGILRTFR